MYIRITAILILLFCVQTAAFSLDKKQEEAGFIPVDSRWNHPQFLTFRPADAQVAAANAPRFSWPYVKDIWVPYRQPIVPTMTFVFEISKSKRMSRPVVEVETPWNFYNFLKPLPNGTWYWRVGYKSSPKGKPDWSETRSFIIDKTSVKWDRSGYPDALKKLAKMKHPRLWPSKGKWFTASDAKDREMAQIKRVTLKMADQALAKPWMKQMPKTDLVPKTAGRTEKSKFSYMTREMAICAMAYHLTNDKKYLAAIQPLIDLAKYPPGGASSPECHGGDNKFMTQITEFMAVAYDLLYKELDKKQRQTILDSIQWRLTKSLHERPCFLGKDGMLREGVAITAGSHPFQDFMWNVGPTLLTYGDIPETEQYAEPMLHYLSGVSGGAGQDEAYNEGPFYGLEKTATMMRAMLYTQLLMPETEMGKNPYLQNLGRWLTHLFPVGIERLPFGDIGAGDQSLFNIAWRGGASHARQRAWLTQDGHHEHRYEVLRDYAIELGPYKSPVLPYQREPWLFLLAEHELGVPDADRTEATSAFFPIEGWAMFSNQQPSDRTAWEKAVGMILQMRPRGGYSHSYRSDGTFVWYAYGKTLSAGGGTMLKMNRHTASSHPHNVILIDGVGQEFDAFRAKTPWLARPLLYKEEKNYTHVVADMSLAYPTTELVRWHRHIIFLDETVFVIYDDLEAKKDSQFSWRFHIHADSKLDLDTENPAFSWKDGDVSARVTLANPGKEVDILDLEGREGFKNPITGEDHTDKISVMAKKLTARLKGQRDYKGGDIIDTFMTKHAIWVTNKKKEKEYAFLSVLTAAPKGDKLPRVEVIDENAVEVQIGARKTSIRFGRGRKADIMIDLDDIQEYAEDTDPR